MRIDHSASTIPTSDSAVIDDLTTGGTMVCDPPTGDQLREPAEAPYGLPWEGDSAAVSPRMGGDEEEAGEIDDFDEEDFDDEFDDDFEEELEDEYDLADLEEVSDDDLIEDDADLPIGGDFVDEDEEPEEPAVPEDPEAPAEEEEKPKKGKGKSAKGKKKAEDDDDDDDLDLDDDE